MALHLHLILLVPGNPSGGILASLNTDIRTVVVVLLRPFDVLSSFGELQFSHTRVTTSNNAMLLAAEGHGAFQLHQGCTVLRDNT